MIQIARDEGDINARVCPKALAYLRGWLAYRRDVEGWMIYDCFWESGQDVSSRFGPQQTGGTIFQHVRPVDLQANVALIAEILARWATILATSGKEKKQEISVPAYYASETAFWSWLPLNSYGK